MVALEFHVCSWGAKQNKILTYLHGHCGSRAKSRIKKYPSTYNAFWRQKLSLIAQYFCRYSKMIFNSLSLYCSKWAFQRSLHITFLIYLRVDSSNPLSIIRIFYVRKASITWHIPVETGLKRFWCTFVFFIIWNKPGLINQLIVNKRVCALGRIIFSQPLTECHFRGILVRSSTPFKGQKYYIVPSVWGNSGIPRLLMVSL